MRPAVPGPGTRLCVAALVALGLVAGCGTARERGTLIAPVPPSPVASVPLHLPDLPAGVVDRAAATVGPLFAQGASGSHSCTASVLDSPAADLILTAAHCLVGTGSGMLFAPGYHGGVTPYGVWTVLRAYADPQWLASGDSGHDYAILQVADESRNGRLVGVQSVTGGNRLSTAPPAGQAVTVIAYNAGRNDEPVRCDTVVRDEGAFPAFDCDGFSTGTSGGPWLARTTGSSELIVTAVIGGLHGGGCDPATSYSSAFGQPVLDLLTRAIAGQGANVLPDPPSEGC